MIWVGKYRSGAVNVNLKWGISIHSIDRPCYAAITLGYTRFVKINWKMLQPRLSVFGHQSWNLNCVNIWFYVSSLTFVFNHVTLLKGLVKTWHIVGKWPKCWSKSVKGRSTHPGGGLNGPGLKEKLRTNLKTSFLQHYTWQNCRMINWSLIWAKGLLRVRFQTASTPNGFPSLPDLMDLMMSYYGIYLSIRARHSSSAPITSDFHRVANSLPARVTLFNKSNLP